MCNNCVKDVCDVTQVTLIPRQVFSGLLMIVLFVSFCTLTFSADRCMQITGSKVGVSSPLFIWLLNLVPPMYLLSFTPPSSLHTHINTHPSIHFFFFFFGRMSRSCASEVTFAAWIFILSPDIANGLQFGKAINCQHNSCM